MLKNTGLVWDLQRVDRVAQSFSKSLDPKKIAQLATDGLVEQFNCAFARIWLVEPDGKMLQLAASSGLYTRTDGSFSRIPIGAYKIGRIAQNRVSLLSNNLANETWIRYPEWAIANNLKSFAGYPLVSSDKIFGVLAIFSHEPMRSEFQEVLSSLCTALTVALEIASLHQEEQIDSQTNKPITLAELSLADSLAYLLGHTKLTVVGTERCLHLSQISLFLKVAEILKTLDCNYCRLTYEADSVFLEAIVTILPKNTQDRVEWGNSIFGNLFSIASCSGGNLKINTEASIKAIQISLEFPAPVNTTPLPLRIKCRSPLLQTGFSQLACSAGLKVCTSDDFHTPLLTDMSSLAEASDRIIWVNNNSKIPDTAKAQVDLATTPSQLRDAVATVNRGDTYRIDDGLHQKQQLSHREQEVIALLASGLRDRDIAEKLYISDSTVKFHINNILVKLEAKTRLQALYKLMSSDGLEI
ncbi:GAF domain-containing protein [Pleurocapsales cyanobacterium LEGE 10410]|nr:GAF domain-containing protein [Pleurocapsales cyanobacterium LEGE 10410]